MPQKRQRKQQLAEPEPAENFLEPGSQPLSPAVSGRGDLLAAACNLVRPGEGGDSVGLGGRQLEEEGMRRVIASEGSDHTVDYGVSPSRRDIRVREALIDSSQG